MERGVHKETALQRTFCPYDEKDLEQLQAEEDDPHVAETDRVDPDAEPDTIETERKHPPVVVENSVSRERAQRAFELEIIATFHAPLSYVHARRGYVLYWTLLTATASGLAYAGAYPLAGFSLLLLVAAAVTLLAWSHLVRLR